MGFSEVFHSGTSELELAETDFCGALSVVLFAALLSDGEEYVEIDSGITSLIEADSCFFVQLINVAEIARRVSVKDVFIASAPGEMRQKRSN